MSEIPELTDAEATVLRYRLLHLDEAHDESALRKRGLLGDPEWTHSGAWWRVPNLGRAALAAYDAKKLAAIRVEAMRECEEIALANLAVDPPYDHELEVQENIAEAIREKIAKEPTQ